MGLAAQVARRAAAPTRCPERKRLFLPMRTGRGNVGVVGLDSDRPGPLLEPDQRRLFDALADQAALAIERINLAQDVDRARIAAETERLRSALLTSISHDLRTPLASILGSATSLKSYRSTLDEAEQNQLDRNDPGRGRAPEPLHLRSAGHDAAGVGRDRAAERAGRPGRYRRQRASPGRKDPRRHQVEIDLPPDLADGEARSRCCSSRCCSICSTTPPNMRRGGTDRLTCPPNGRVNRSQSRVMDEGDGIPEADLERIFDKFYRVRAGDRQRAGTGLGLAICRGFVEAHGRHDQRRQSRRIARARCSPSACPCRLQSETLSGAGCMTAGSLPAQGAHRR